MNTPAPLPSTQTAWRHLRRGTPAEALELVHDAPVPGLEGLKDDEVLVKVHAAALNPVGFRFMALPNWMVRRPIAAAEYDLSGTVVRAGVGVPAPLRAPGTRVFGTSLPNIQACTKAGALAQYTVYRAGQLAPLPASADLRGAAGLGLAGSTAHQALHGSARVRAGQTVLVYGAGSSVGLLAVQIAKAAGCVVWASASRGKEALARELGADEFVDYAAAPIADTLAGHPSKPMFDAIYDAAGILDPALFVRSPAYLRAGGVYVTAGMAPQTSGAFLAEVGRFLWAALKPRWLGGTPRQFVLQTTQVRTDTLEALAKLMEEGKLKVVLDSTFPFEDALNGYSRLMSGKVQGKVVILVE